MTRFGFFLFNLLLTVCLYGLVYLGGPKPAIISYVLHNFSIPYLVLIFLMILISTIRWFMSHDPDIGREIVTWVHALWFVTGLTVLALYLMGAIEGHFWHGLRSLLTLR